jgi:cell division protein FtsB
MTILLDIIPKEKLYGILKNNMDKVSTLEKENEKLKMLVKKMEKKIILLENGGGAADRENCIFGH